MDDPGFKMPNFLCAWNFSATGMVNNEIHSDMIACLESTFLKKVDIAGSYTAEGLC